MAKFFDSVAEIAHIPISETRNERAEMGTQEELLEAVESLKNIMVSRAVGGSPNDGEYLIHRKTVVSNPDIDRLVPRFVKTNRSLHEFWQFIKGKFKHYSERNQFISEQFEPLLSHLEAGIYSPLDSEISLTLSKVDGPHVNEAWAKALKRRDVDPEAAITSARTLIETVCKHILEDHGDDYKNDEELPKLYKKVAELLNLSPSQHTEDVFKRILGGCTSVVEGLGAMRNRHSDAHGTGKGAVKPARRHAQLAVNLAGSMAMFLYETWEHVKSKHSS